LFGAGVEMDGNLSWKSLLVWSHYLLVMWLIMSRPIEDSPFLKMAALLSMVRRSPPIHPSSRYQTFWSDLTLGVTPWMVRVKRAGLRESPYCTPVAELKQNSMKKRRF